MKKPKLSFWQIWNLSFGFLGVQIGYSLQNSNTSSILQSLGADLSHLSYFWLAAPLAGLIIQPIIGIFSDGTWTRFGRRIPYILGGAVISTIALLLMPNCPVLLAFAPLAMGALILLFMDLSFNVTMQPFRALVTDMLDDSQKTEGFVIQTFLINLGAVIGAILPLIMTLCGVSDEPVDGGVSKHIAYSYYFGGGILLLTVLVTAFKVKEYPPEEFALYNSKEDREEGPAEKPGFIKLMKNMPKTMLQLSVTQFFSWAALFLMWNYLKPLITGSFIDESGTGVNIGAAETWTGVLNAVYPVPACIVAIFMTRIAGKFGNKAVYAACLLCGAVGYLGLTFINNKYAMMIPMIGIGIAWAGILAMPYSILSKAIDARSSGAYMGIFNFTITIPQIIMGLAGGSIVRLIKNCVLDGRNYEMLSRVEQIQADSMSAGWMIIIAAVFMLTAAISVYFVSDKTEN